MTDAVPGVPRGARIPGPIGRPGAPWVMGVLNVTPDSFSDGGRYLDPQAAVARGRELFAEGADLVDVGGESTRPGADPVPAAEQLRRVLPVVEALAPLGRVSIDTRDPEVAAAALEAGACVVNDVSASLAEVAAAAGAGWVAMHLPGDPRTMQHDPRYDDVVADVTAFLVARAEAGRAAGAAPVWIDPGIGFGKTTTHNLALLGRLGDLVATGWPVAVGTSRKAFLGRILAASDARTPLPPDPEAPQVPTGDRREGSLSTATWAMLAGASMVRVHDVAGAVLARALVCPDVLADARNLAGPPR